MNGEVSKTEQVWHEYRKELKGFILSKVKDRNEAEDILQEVFVKVHLNLSGLKDQARLRSWIYQVTRNAIQDHFRRRKFLLAIENIDLADGSEEKEALNFHKCMSPFVEKLPGKYKEALILSDFKKLSQITLAQKLKISYSAAKSRVQRARRLLRSYFTDCCDITTDKYGNIVSHVPKGKCLCVC